MRCKKINLATIDVRAVDVSRCGRQSASVGSADGFSFMTSCMTRIGYGGYGYFLKYEQFNSVLFNSRKIKDKLAYTQKKVINNIAYAMLSRIVYSPTTGIVLHVNLSMIHVSNSAAVLTFDCLHSYLQEEIENFLFLPGV